MDVDVEEGVVAGVDVDVAAFVKKEPSNLCLRARKDNRVGDLPHHQMQVDADVEVVEGVVGVDVDAVNHVIRQTTSSEEERGEAKLLRL